MAGPEASLAAQAASSAANLPGLASRIAAAVPSAAAALPYVGASALALAVPAVAAAAVQSIANTVNSEISGYSSDVAAANAVASVGEMMRNIRTAQTLGPEVAANTRLWNSLKDDTLETRNAIKETLLWHWDNILYTLSEITNPEKADERRAELQALRRKADDVKDLGIKLYEPGSFLNIVPQRPNIPWPKSPTERANERIYGGDDRSGALSF
jgi:hypothetical protein